MDDTIKAVIATLMVVGLIAVVIGVPWWLHSNYQSSKKIITITIDEKWIKGVGESSQKYLVADTNNNVYEITDDWANNRWNSSDYYAYFEPGMTVTVETIGWRIPWLSEYPNILRIIEVRDE